MAVPAESEAAVQQLHVKLPADLAARLKRRALADERTVSAEVRHALRVHLGDEQHGD